MDAITEDFPVAPSVGRDSESAAVNAQAFPTFLRFVCASIFGLLALSSAAIVDGVVVGKYLGADALAAVNLLIPFSTFFFGVALMLAIGGSVEAGKLLGAGRDSEASQVMFRTMVSVLVFAIVLVALAWAFADPLFNLLAVPSALRPLLAPYFFILLVGAIPQLIAVVLYYFVRMAGYPGEASRALMIGAASNIILDVVLVAVLKMDLRAAAWATVVAQLTQCGTLIVYFFKRQKRLTWQPVFFGWRNWAASAANGFSEFINEISAGLVLLAVHWLLTRQQGTDAVAGFALVNYSLLVNVMIACAVAEVVHVLASQNLGAGQLQRARQFRRYGFATVLMLGGLLFLLVQVFDNRLSSWLFPGQAGDLAQQYWPIVAPVFFLTGCNLIASAWFTSCHKSLISAVLALSRSLILPLGFLSAITIGYPYIHFLWALPLAEVVTLLLALLLLRRQVGAN